MNYIERQGCPKKYRDDVKAFVWGDIFFFFVKRKFMHIFEGMM